MRLMKLVQNSERAHHASLCFQIAILTLLLLATSCAQIRTDTWRASVDNGDKPGIGIELTRRAESLDGRMFLLDPNRPRDFTSGSARPMKIHHFNDNEVRFTVTWKPGVQDGMILRLSSPLQGDKVHAVLESADGSDTPRDYEFVRAR